MVAPTYNHDLVDVDLAEASTNWSWWGGGNVSLSAGPDYAMQGVNAVDTKISNVEKGPYFDNTTGITIPTDAHIYIWVISATAGLVTSLATRGVAVGIGSTSADYCLYHVEGSDTFGAAGRVAKCYPINYAVRSSNTGSAPYRTVTGTPTANPRVFGATTNIVGTVKGSNFAVDAIRYGKGAFVKDGELISAGDGSDNPCTFADFSIQNDRNEASFYNRWGILTKVGISYELQGTFAIGQTNTGTAALCRFKDSDRAIVIVDTPHTTTTFSKIIIDHASTRCELTNINITALGTNNKGQFTVTTANPTVIITGGTWTDMGAITLRSNTTVSGITWRRTGLVTNNGATLSSFTFDKSTAASSLLLADLANATSGHFISDGSNHAVELNSIGSGTMTWNNTLTGYAAGTSASPVTPTSTGNEAIYVNVTDGVLTINVATGATIPSIRSAGATVNVVSGLITLSVTVKDASTGSAIGTTSRVYLVRSSDKSVLINSACNASGVASTQIAYDADTAVEGWARDMDLAGNDYIPRDISGTYTASGFSVTVNLERR